MNDEVEERGLTILVPEVEDFVRAFRAQYSSLAANEIPAHISINHPFCPAAEKESRLEEILADLFAGIATFKFSLTEVRRFPEALYLVPEPEECFTALITAVADRFPQSPPYEGRFEDIIPHLTVAYLEDAQGLDAMSDALYAAAAKVLPLHAQVRGVQLIEKVGGKWRERRSFPLGS
jgi:2'-5' RNA ligase